MQSPYIVNIPHKDFQESLSDREAGLFNNLATNENTKNVSDNT